MSPTAPCFAVMSPREITRRLNDSAEVIRKVRRGEQRPTDAAATAARQFQRQLADYLYWNGSATALLKLAFEPIGRTWSMLVRRQLQNGEYVG